MLLVCKFTILIIIIIIILFCQRKARQQQVTDAIVAGQQGSELH